MAAPDVSLPVAAEPVVSSPAVDSGAVSVPEAPVTPQPSAVPDKPEGQSQPEYLREALAKLGEKIPTDKPAVVPAVPEPVKTAEPVKVEEAKPVELVVEENPLDKIGPLPAEQIAKILQENPQAGEQLKALGLDPDAMIETSRTAALASQYQDLYPTMEAAHLAHEAAGHFFDLDSSFTTLQTVQDLDGFLMEKMLPLSYVTDEKGEPIKNPDGTFKTDGSVARFMSLNTDLDLAMIAQGASAKAAAAKQAGGEDEQAEQLLAALDIVNGFRQGGYKFGPPPAEMTPEQKKQQERLDAQTKQLQDKETQTQQLQKDTHEDRILKATVDGIAPLIKSALDQTALDDYGKTTAAKEIYDLLTAELEGNKNYGAEQQRIDARYKLSDDGYNKRVGQNLGWMKQRLPKILDTVFQKAGARRIAAHTERQQKIDTQVATSRMDPARGTRTAGQAGAKLSDDEKFAKAKAEVIAENGGREPMDISRRIVSKLLSMNSQ